MATTNHVNALNTTYGIPLGEGWDEFVSWDGGDLIDTLFQGGSADCQHVEHPFIDFHQPESVVSDFPSAPPSVTEGATSDCSFSLPNSITSPAALATSPFWGRNDRVLTDSFNPFSPLESVHPQAFDNVGVWTDQPPLLIEPLPEQDHARGIAIPHSNSRSYGNSFSSSPWLEVPPILSTSPTTSESSRSIAIPNSLRNDPRAGSNSFESTSSSSTKYGWVQYQVSSKTSRLVPSGAGSNNGKRQRGRTKALSIEQRKNAALMRVIGACSNCRRRKEKCDPGIPCRSCIEHYKTSLPHHPCRSRLLTSLTSVFLSERLGWHPTSRPLSSFLGPTSYTVLTNSVYTIPLTLGFGPSMHLQVHPVNIPNSNALYHTHVIYPWPPSATSSTTHVHAVFPATLTTGATEKLKSDLDAHLRLLVNSHFRAFPLYCSDLRLLREIYILFKLLPPSTSESGLLLQALKLLVLVHIGGDLTLSPEYVAAEEGGLDTVPPTPCFIRSQFGAVMPSLAISLMHDVLERLERLALTRECSRWAIVISTIIIILMSVESVQYHAAKVPYHTAYDLPATQEGKAKERVRGREMDEQGVDAMLNFYKACYGVCHHRLRDDLSGGINDGQAQRHRIGLKTPEDRFEEGLRAAVRKAEEAGYLAEREKVELGQGQGQGESEDMGAFFDRLVARLVLLKT